MKEPRERDWAKLEEQAKRVRDRNTARIEAGETFRSRKKSGREPAPSKDRGKR